MALLAILYTAFTATIREGEVGIRSRMGEPIAVLTSPGLHFKWPFPIEEMISVDVRRRVFQTRHTELLTQDKRNIILLTDVVWSVADALLFFQSVGTTPVADEKLDGLITNAKIGILGKYPLAALASTDPATIKVEQIEAALLAETAPEALVRYGITLHTVGFSRLSLPEENVKAVFKQMRAERKQYAAQYIVEGEKEASSIRAETDLKVAEIAAHATEEAARIKGESEAEAARIYAEAHSEDPDLYRFVRSLQTLDESMGARTTVILRTDSAPFRLLTTPK